MWHTALLRGYELSSVPIDLLTRKMCRLAVEYSPTNLEYVPLYFRSRELCSYAVCRDNAVFDLVPPEHRETVLHALLKARKIRKPECIFLFRFDLSFRKIGLMRVDSLYIDSNLRIIGRLEEDSDTE